MLLTRRKKPRTEPPAPPRPEPPSGDPAGADDWSDATLPPVPGRPRRRSRPARAGTARLRLVSGGRP